jgi:Protein of unknown function (DUF3048) N-terminal domain
VYLARFMPGHGGRPGVLGPEVWMSRSRLGLACAAVLIAAVAACGGEGGGDKKKSAPTTTVPRPVAAPLTGLPDPGQQSLNRPALSVKIENTEQSRPQTGLEVADVVYEEVTEADITRFMAVFTRRFPTSSALSGRCESWTQTSSRHSAASTRIRVAPGKESTSSARCRV